MHLSTPVMKHGKFVLFFYSILINVCTETDVRESADNYTLASGKGHSSRGETFHPIYAASPVSSSVEHHVCYKSIETYGTVAVMQKKKKIKKL
jgi:hypothetical protein